MCLHIKCVRLYYIGESERTRHSLLMRSVGAEAVNYFLAVLPLSVAASTAIHHVCVLRLLISLCAALAKLRVDTFRRRRHPLSLTCTWKANYTLSRCESRLNYSVDARNKLTKQRFTKNWLTWLGEPETYYLRRQFILLAWEFTQSMERGALRHREEIAVFVFFREHNRRYVFVAQIQTNANSYYDNC